MNIAYLALGSNINKEHNLPAAVRLLAAHGRVLRASVVYETAPVGNPDDPAFFNAAVMLETPLSAKALKETVLIMVENQLGRQRTADPNAARTIDLDIALFNHEVLDIGQRHIPDPDILRFAHVTAPLADLAPAYHHPETGETLAAIAARLPSLLIRRPDIVLLPPDAPTS